MSARNMLEDIYVILRDLPVGVNLKLCKERSEEGDHVFLSAVLTVDPPETGWSSRGARFNHPAGSSSYQEPCLPQHRFEPRVIVGMGTDSPKDAARLTLEMLKERVAELRRSSVRDG